MCSSMAEQRPVKPWDVGSSPTTSAKVNFEVILMYRYVKSNKSTKEIRYIDITVMFDSENQADNVAAVNLVHPQNIKKRKRWNDTQIAFYSSFIDNVIDIVQTQFTILEQGQSTKSYSYYITFDATDTIQYKVRFRIADHVQKPNTDKPPAQISDGRKMLFRNIVIGQNKEFTSYIQVIQAITKICDGIAEGDADVMFVDYTNYNFEE